MVYGQFREVYFSLLKRKRFPELFTDKTLVLMVPMVRLSFWGLRLHRSKGSFLIMSLSPKKMYEYFTNMNKTLKGPNSY